MKSSKEILLLSFDLISRFSIIFFSILLHYLIDWLCDIILHLMLFFVFLFDMLFTRFHLTFYFLSSYLLPTPFFIATILIILFLFFYPLTSVKNYLFLSLLFFFQLRSLASHFSELFFCILKIAMLGKEDRAREITTTSQTHSLPHHPLHCIQYLDVVK